jgi:hypothetical protein
VLSSPITGRTASPLLRRALSGGSDVLFTLQSRAANSFSKREIVSLGSGEGSMRMLFEKSGQKVYNKGAKARRGRCIGQPKVDCYAKGSTRGTPAGSK